MAEPKTEWQASPAATSASASLEWLLESELPNSARDADAAIPLLVELDGPHAAALANTLAAQAPLAAPPVQLDDDLLLVFALAKGAALLGGPPKAPGTDGALAHVSAVTHGDAMPLRAFTAHQPTPDRKRPERPKRPKRPDCPADKIVVTAIIDNAAPMAHALLRDASGGTRVHYAWVQNAPAAGNVPYGREFTKADIDALLAQHSTGGIVDEDGFYRSSYQADFGLPNHHALGYLFSHGANVTHQATGYPAAENRVDRPVILVQLPPSATANTSGASLIPHLMAALKFITERTDQIAEDFGLKSVPLVINFSYGTISGPLDGSSRVERRLDQIIARRNAKKKNTVICLPAGNAYQSRCHAHVVKRDFKGPDAECTLTLRVQPDDHTASFTDIWLPFSAAPPAASQLSVAITPPGAGQSLFLPELPGQGIEWAPNGQVLARLRCTWVPSPGGGRIRFRLKLRPTADHHRSNRLAPSGNWLITLRDTGLGASDHVDLWIARDESLPGYGGGGRQSRFSDPRYVERNALGYPEQRDPGPSPIHRRGTQNGLSAGDQVIVVGGYVVNSGQMAPYSAGGTNDAPRGPGPDVMAPSDTSAVHRGQLGATSRSGGMVAMGGTSIATPQVARRLADFMAQGGWADRSTVAAWGQADDPARFTDRAPTPPAYRAEHGRLALPPVVPTRRIDP